jgi:hypothetical protein
VDDDLIPWITTLRERVERNEFAGRGPVSFHRWAPGLPLEQLIRVMLADLDGWKGLPAHHREQRVNVVGRLRLVDDFKYLRELLG